MSKLYTSLFTGIGAIVVICAIGLSAYFYQHTDTSVPAVPSVPAAAAPVSTISTSTIPAPQASIVGKAALPLGTDWNIYRDKEFGYSMKNPSGTQLTTTDMSDGKRQYINFPSDLPTYYGLMLPNVTLEITNNDWKNGVKVPSQCETLEGYSTEMIIDGVRFVRMSANQWYETSDSRALAMSYCVVNDSGVKYQLIPHYIYTYDRQLPDMTTSYYVFDKVIQALDFQFIPQ